MELPKRAVGEGLAEAIDFVAFHSEYAERVRRLLARSGVRASDLDDVLQEALITIHRLLPTFEGRSSIETWLRSLTWRIAANYHRQVRRRAEVAIDPVQVLIDHAPVPQDDRARLRHSLLDLDDEHRDLFALHHIGGLSISQLSDLSGSARATIRQRLERGRAAIGRRLWKALTESDQSGSSDHSWASFVQNVSQGPRALLRPTVCDEGVISVLEDTVLVLERGAPSIAVLEELVSAMSAITDTHPEGVRLLAIVESTSTPPTREGRKLIAWATRKLGPKVRAAAWAVESSALMTLVAPVMNTRLFLGGVPVNARFFGAVAPAAVWLAGHGTGASPGSDEIAKHVEVMRGCLPTPSGR